jgi:hypothetical protein
MLTNWWNLISPQISGDYIYNIEMVINVRNRIGFPSFIFC